MKIIIAPDSFKGSMSASQAATRIAHAAATVFPHAEIQTFPVADGGEGTIAAVFGTIGGTHYSTFIDNHAITRKAQWIKLSGDTALIESAEVVGLPLIPQEQRDPGRITTHGIGHMIKHALDEGCRHIIVGLGGTASNDGGIGLAEALGAKFFDEHDQRVPAMGYNLQKIAHIDMLGWDPRMTETTVTGLSDITSPLYGPDGAANVFARQKGASPEQILDLDAGLRHLSTILSKDLAKDVHNQPGAGAGGGLGAGLLAFCQATLTPGAPFILDLMRYDQNVSDASLVITGEGMLDRQITYGKALAAVAAKPQELGIPVIALVGSLGEGFEMGYSMGLSAMFSILPHPTSLERALEYGPEWLENTALRVLQLYKLGAASY